MPTRIEGDLDRSIVPHRWFMVFEQSVDADRVPIAQSGGFTSPVPRSHRVPVPTLDQQPPPPGTETRHSEQEPIVPRAAGLPQLAFRSEHRAQGVALAGDSQVEGSRFGNGEGDRKSVV